MSASTTPVELPIDAAERPSRVRYGVLTLLALAATISYLSRIGLSTANTTIQREFGISDAQMGSILSAFFLGYFFFQIPTGWLSVRYGSRITLALLNVLASLCSVWTGLATGAAPLFASRISLGVAQAGLVPCASRGVVDWFPLSRRGMASSAIAGCMSLGAALAQGLTALLMPVLGWRGVFFAYGGVGIAWAAAYYLYFRDRPAGHPLVNRAERELIETEPARTLTETHVSPSAPAERHVSPSSTAAAPGDVPLEVVAPSRAERWRATVALMRVMAGSPSAWLICGQALFRAFGAAFFLTWFPAYLEKGHGVRLQESGFLAMLPLCGSVLGAVAGGQIVDLLLRRTGSRRISRSGTATTGLVLAAVCTAAAVVAPSPAVLVLLLTIGSFCFSTSGPVSWAATMDISGRHTQILFALSNMCGNIGAYFSPLLVGLLFERVKAGHAGWDVILYLFVAIHLASALCWAFFNPNRSAVEARPGV